VERLFRIAEILDVSVKEVLGFEANNIFSNSPNQQGGSYVAYNNTEVDIVRNLYERLLAEKDAVIAQMQQKAGEG
jgi:hypothetical protein